MWKVKQMKDGDRVVLSLSGRLEGEHLNELLRVFASEAASQNLILDLKELRLVDQHAVSFLADCETRGASLRNCPAYIREWIGAETKAREFVPD
jgi:anti-anti-sigma regulatory factor